MGIQRQKTCKCIVTVYDMVKCTHFRFQFNEGVDIALRSEYGQGLMTYAVDFKGTASVPQIATNPKLEDIAKVLIDAINQGDKVAALALADWVKEVYCDEQEQLEKSRKT